jgi:hypothetical protein
VEFVVSIRICYLPYFGVAAPKYGVVCVFRQISTVTALSTDTVTAKLLLDY